MDHFAPKEGTLHAEDVSLAHIAARFGTPTYVYSRATIQRHVKVLQAGMGGLPHHICYAVKANGNLALLQLMRELGVGFDAVSVGELARVLKAGGPPSQTIVSGVGKRDDEIAAALRCGVLYLCVESEAELERTADIASELGVRAPVSIRVNPDVDPKTHPYIATGLTKNKFGVPWARAKALYAKHQHTPSLELLGVTCHIGSQITELAPFEDAARRMAALAEELLALGLPLRYLGMGGGLGVPYGHETPPAPDRYGAALAGILGHLGLTLVLEPGRVIVGNAGVLLTQVVRTKTGGDRAFVLVDAGMNDLLRPALYQAHHQIVPVHGGGAAALPVDMVGPVCESADTFASDVELPPLQPGDLVALRTAGAYGFVMASNYNGRPRPAEVMVDGSRAVLIRQRETLADLWRGEHDLSGAPISAELPAPLKP